MGNKRFFTVVYLISSIILIVWIFYSFFTFAPGMAIEDLSSNTKRLATNFFFNKMTAFAQLSIALLGGLWAFLSLADTQIKIEGWEIVTCFGLTNLMLGSSLISYAWGYDFIVERLFYHSSFDIEAPLVSFVKNTQQYLFLDGCLGFCITIIFGRKMT